MPASTAASLLDGRASGSVDKARGMTPDDLFAAIERSGLRGRGGAGYPLAKKIAAVRSAALLSGREPLVIANAYDADPGSPLARTLIERNLASLMQGVAIAAHAVGADEALVYMHPEANGARSAVEQDVTTRSVAFGSLTVTVAIGPGGFMGGEESALMNVLESRRATARQRPPYPAGMGVQMRPTLISSAETLAWLPQIVSDGARADTKLVSVTGAVTAPGVYEVPLGITLAEILERAGGVRGQLKAIQVGGPTGGILAASKGSVRLGFEELKAAGTHMGSAQIRAIANDTCIVAEAAKMFAYLSKETCGICIPCRVGTSRVQGILESVQSQLGRDTDIAWLGDLGDHMEKFSLCGFGITAPSILRTTMLEFAEDYRAHIQERRCPNGTCKPIRARRYETMAQP
ncbi:MAG TPA: NADH-ubiquinone oxidoreductase-F iron-sulfur binding region domain-containing protein [Candidatus Limnocylindrales bacterium]|nr:NADH-ubiquinone oxidoreductase-F iron-sulfur binding region domain-containing protein [Candidatus Limnocylindrales bacterium]